MQVFCFHHSVRSTNFARTNVCSSIARSSRAGSVDDRIFPTEYGLYFTTVIMSIGFHYFEAVKQSLSLQWLKKEEFSNPRASYSNWFGNVFNRLFTTVVFYRGFPGVFLNKL